jgi:hypothetical protein
VSKGERTKKLELDQDLDFQRKEWIVNRWCWIVIILFMLAGLLGVFGEGPLSDTTARDGAVTVQYGRFERLLASTQIQVRVDLPPDQNGEQRVRVDQSLLDYYTIQHIIPEPDSEELSPDHITLVYRAPQGGGPVNVTLNLQANKVGMARGKIGAETGPLLPVSQFIYP